MTEITRRSVLAGAGGAVGAACLAACSKGPNASASSAPTTAGASAPAASGSAAPVPLADVPVGSGKLSTFDGKPVIITQPVAGQPAVFLNQCTHQGCQLAVQGA